MLPLLSPSTLLPSNTYTHLSISLHPPASLFLSTSQGNLTVLDLSSSEPSEKWESPPQDNTAGHILDMVADNKSTSRAFLLRQFENSTWIETVTPSSRHSWGSSLKPTALGMQSGRQGYLVVGSASGEMYTSDGENVQFHGRLDLDEAEPVIMVRCKKDRLVGCVTRSGRAYLSLLRESPPLLGVHRLHLGAEQEASCIALAPDLPLCAVGRREAPRVSLYAYAQEHRVVNAQWVRELVLFGPTRVEEERLAGSVLGVGLGLGGCVAATLEHTKDPALWNGLLGTRTGGGTLSPESASSALCFHGYSLWYLSPLQHAMRQPLVRLMPGLHRHPCRLALVGPDHVTLLRPDERGWTRVDLPEPYARHEPVRCVALDAALRVAVAGSRGFAVYLSSQLKWRLFQSVLAEEALGVLGMAWLPNKGGFLACACDDLSWKVFDVRERIAQPSELAGLVSPPLSVDFCGSEQMLGLFASGVEVYAIDPVSGALSRTRFVARHPLLVGWGVHLVAVSSALRALVLDASGRLALVDLESETWLACRGGVGDCWAVPDKAVGVVVWMQVEGGLAVWAPSLDPLAEAAALVSLDVALDLCFTPVGPSRIDGALVSFDSRVNALGPFVQSTTSPCLHGLLQWLLRTRRDGLARRVLAQRAQTRLVQSALEDLLQAVLHDEHSIRRVVGLLGCVPFPALASIVTHCARQIDPGLWDALFSVVGQPADLFEQCLNTYDSGGGKQLLRTASELLPILDDAQGDSFEGPASRARRVLDRCGIDDGQLRDEINDYCRKRNLNVEHPGVQATSSDGGGAGGLIGIVLELIG